MAKVTLTVSLCWDQVEPDGSNCIACGEPCFLKMWQAFSLIEGIRGKQPLEVLLCDSCHEVSREKK